MERFEEILFPFSLSLTGGSSALVFAAAVSGITEKS